MHEPLPIALDRRNGPRGSRARDTSRSYVGSMTTSAVSVIDPATMPSAQPDVRLPGSVANPRRTIWTGFAKSDADRLPAG